MTQNAVNEKETVKNNMSGQRNKTDPWKTKAKSSRKSTGIQEPVSVQETKDKKWNYQ